MVGRHPTEPYEAFLSVYSPEGLFIERVHMGQISPTRRKYFDVSEISSRLVPGVDHLAVAHRIPSRIVEQVRNLEDTIEMDEEPDYSMFRSVVEYSYPDGGNGSVIYETPPRLNLGMSDGISSNTITFTCQTVLSDVLNTHVILIHHSMNPKYSNIATFNYGLHSPSGELAASGEVKATPFSIKVLDISQIVPKNVQADQRDTQDGVSNFSFVGYSEDASFLVVVVNTALSLGAVSVEHTHPPQTYLIPWDSRYQREAKTTAQKAWQSILPQPPRN